LITDAYSKLIVGYCLHSLLTSEGCLRALEMALQQPKATTLIHYSDRGSQYCSFLYIRKLKEASIAISMSQYIYPYENAIVERVNGILKTDFRLNHVFTSFEEAARAVERSIYNYNHLRPHMSCDYLTPAATHSKDQPLKKTLETQAL
jgi:putative transposase